jgi:NADP-dependent 3-hydroxy acid dehydrogenase YdfG
MDKQTQFCRGNIQLVSRLKQTHQEIHHMADSKRFQGTTAFISGAASGVRAAAVPFAAECAPVVITDRAEAA